MSLGYLCSKIEIPIALCMLADRHVARSYKIGHVYINRRIFPKRMNYFMAQGVLARIDGERSSLYSSLQSQAPEQSAVERKSKIMNGTNEERN